MQADRYLDEADRREARCLCYALPPVAFGRSVWNAGCHRDARICGPLRGFVPRPDRRSAGARSAVRGRRNLVGVTWGRGHCQRFASHPAHPFANPPGGVGDLLCLAGEDLVCGRGLLLVQNGRSLVVG